MLFDLRGRGRRRTVQAIYLSLAILMGGGLVLFGIGGDVQGGLFDAFDDGTQRQGADVVQQRLKQAEERVRTRPQDAGAWGTLADVRFQTANSAEYLDQTTGVYSSRGREVLRGAKQAWDRHLALAGDKPDADVAQKMVIALGEAGLRDFDAAVRAQEVVIEADPEPNAAKFARLAILAEAAGQTRKSQLAEDRAVELTPRAQREEVRAQIALGKQQATGQGAGAGAGAPGTGQPEPVAPGSG